MVHMKAAVVSTPGGRFDIADVILDDPRPDEVLVKLVASGVCHTDMVYRDRLQAPSVFGHEGAGIVEQVGRNVHGFAKGDKVLMSFVSCGECRNCLKGHPAYCRQFGSLNTSGFREDGSVTIHDLEGNDVRGSFLAQSSFGEYSLAMQRNLVKVADDTPLELLEILGPLGCGVQTGAGAVLNSLSVEAGASVVIFGAGGVGLSAVLGAVVAGAAIIVVSDVNEDRLEKARALGATHTVVATDPNGPEKIIALTNGGADYSVETSGNMGAARTSVDVLNPTGTAAMVGVGRPGAELQLDHAFLRAGRRIMGVIEGDSIPQEFIPALIELFKQGRFGFDSFVTRYPFADIQQAIDDSESGRTIKGVLVYDR